MKSILLAVLTALVMCLPGGQVQGAGSQEELMTLAGRIQAKVESGKDTEADYQTELKELDALVAKLRQTEPEVAAQAALAKAVIYRKTFKERTRALAMLEQLVKEFPGTQVARAVPEMITELKLLIEMQRIRETLKPGTKFPDFAEKDLTGKPLSLADYKGKVVLVDFWATWCTLCVEALPEVKKAYSKYNKQGFEIIGISLDEDRKELNSFIKKQGIKWRNYNDGKEWESKLALQYGVESLPTTYLLDREGKIIGMDLEGKELMEAVAKALKK